MHQHVSASFKSRDGLFSPFAASLHNPRSVSHSLSYYYPYLKCASVDVSVHKQRRLNSLRSGSGSAEDDKLKPVGVKDIDVATIGNLCVDVVLSVPCLPPKPLGERRAYMEELSKLPPDEKHWEAGGNCNMAIAASRFGLHVITVGHVGRDIYGQFLRDVLHDEGIGMVEIAEQDDLVDRIWAAYKTLLCWVLVDPFQRHGFCSGASFSEKPAFSWISRLSIEAKMAIRRSKIIFYNGYDFDELSPGMLVSVFDYALEVGTSIFFDPGPRGKSLVSGTPDERIALDKYLKMSDVLLLTFEEAESLTSISDPILAGKELIQEGIRTKWVIIKMGPKGSILITRTSISCAPAFKVNVMDTVGCGDSFVAAMVFGFIHKMPLVHTLTMANAVGAATAMGYGAGRNVAKLKLVLEIMKASQLNEDTKFWDGILKNSTDRDEVTLLTKTVKNESKKWSRHASIQEVLPNLLPRLESVQAGRSGSDMLKEVVT